MSLNGIPSWGADTLQGFDTTNIQEGQRIGGLNNRQFVRFYKKKVILPAAKKVEIDPVSGMPRTKLAEVREVEREFIHVKTPGDKNEVDDFATDWHKREYFRQYSAFRDGRAAPLGKSLDECDYVPSSLVTELKYLGVHTEEQMADASDILCNQIPSGWELREYSRAFCKAKAEDKGNERVNVLTAELEKNQEVIRQMQEEMKQMQDMILDSSGRPAVKVARNSPRKPKEVITA